MGTTMLTERHAQQIAGVLSCFDRVMVQGTLPVFCYADGMTAYLTKRRIRIFDFTQFARPLTDAIKANAVAFPLMYRAALGAFEQVNSNLLGAARTLGASEWRTF